MLIKIKDRITVESIQVLLKHYIKKNKKKRFTPEDIQHSGRVLSVCIYEMTTIYSGYASKQALLDRKYRKMDWCEDHLYPRQYAGESLLKSFLSQQRVDEDLLISKVLQFCQVNRVTSEENRLLIPFQKSSIFTTPERAYEQVGIQLLEWSNGMRIDKLFDVYPQLR